jgi:hypothetical protein
MKELVKKLIDIEVEISKEKGRFHLFALFLREDSEDKWDLLVAAPWVNESRTDAIKYIASVVQKTLNEDELLKITRVVIIDDANPALGAVHRAIDIEHGSAEINNCNFFGLIIKRGYLITSKSTT